MSRRMSPHPNKILRPREGDLPVSGSITESNPTPTASSLAQDTAAVSDPNATQTGVPLFASSAPISSAVAASSTPATTVNSSPSGGQIPLGTVIGSCMAALIALLLAVVLALYCSRRWKRQSAARPKSRNVANDVLRRLSRLQPWQRMNDDADRREEEEEEEQEQPMKQRPVSGPLGAMFHRTISISSADKSDSHNRESVGTMQHFAKYHAGLAAEMASLGAARGKDGKIAKPAPVLRLVGRDTSPPMSWDGETMGGESFMSLHSSTGSSASPIVVTSAKSTPIAMTSSLHRWERAEVVHVGQGPSSSGMNPFADSRASSIKSKRSSTRGRNPFFSGRDHPVRRPSLPDTTKNPFADPEPPRDSTTAIQSLIAALQEPTGGDSRVTSFQTSSVYSRATGDDAESAVSVTAFPYPPTQIDVR